MRACLSSPCHSVQAVDVRSLPWVLGSRIRNKAVRMDCLLPAAQYAWQGALAYLWGGNLQRCPSVHIPACPAIPSCVCPPCPGCPACPGGFPAPATHFTAGEAASWDLVFLERGAAERAPPCGLG